MPALFVSVICAAHNDDHCRTCRSLVGGRAWRQGVSRALVMPEGGVDFPCPEGKPFTDVPPPGSEIKLSRPPEEIPEGFDPAREVRRMRQGGCCGQPSGD